MMIESFVFVMGTLIGSFLNVCICRLPKNESIITPPSHCPNCQKRLKAWDLIPILSYLIYRGQCRYCSSPISLQYPLIEGLTGLIYLLIYLKFGLNAQAYLSFFFASALIVVSGIDFKHRIIPDIISLPGMVIGILASIFSIQISLLDAVLGILVGGGLFLLIAIFSRGGMGGGDIKLMGFIGAFLGWKGALLTIFFGSLIGSVYGLYLMIFKKVDRKTAIPYGPFLSAGALLFTLYGDALIRFYFQWVLR
ncbi:peptidase A24 [Anoxybacter fermentans]|uniref:Prepilin leader peptidase/N-methyltransferase n=2 Tax=Anoxybacter fermentans TaxID=1323375 RepID=A0A3Q9HQM7_9FIRM|nr:peptidase A24 [Anoxybacter fermentans]